MQNSSNHPCLYASDSNQTTETSNVKNRRVFVVDDSGLAN